MLRRSIIASLSLTLLCLVVPPAEAEDQSSNDAVGDHAGARDNRGDVHVTASEFYLGKDTVSLGTAVNETPTNWQPETVVGWDIATSNQTTFTVLYTYQFAINAKVYDSKGNVVCNAEGTFNPKYSNAYFAKFPNQCLGSPKSWNIKGGILYVDQNKAVTTDDADQCCEVYNN